MYRKCVSNKWDSHCYEIHLRCSVVSPAALVSLIMYAPSCVIQYWLIHLVVTSIVSILEIRRNNVTADRDTLSASVPTNKQTESC
jgi:hypothetical protein